MIFRDTEASNAPMSSNWCFTFYEMAFLQLSIKPIYLSTFALSVLIATSQCQTSHFGIISWQGTNGDHQAFRLLKDLCDHALGIALQCFLLCSHALVLATACMECINEKQICRQAPMAAFPHPWNHWTACSTWISAQACNELKELPLSFGDLACLHHPHPSSGSGLSDFSGSLVCLKDLNSEHCDLRSRLPSMGRRTSLQHQKLSYCWGLQTSLATWSA